MSTSPTGNSIESFDSADEKPAPSLTTRFNAPAIPSELKKLPRWTVWGLDAERTKRPLNPGDLKAAKNNDPSTWAIFETAERAALEAGGGVGFEFGIESDGTDPAGLIGLDLDGCREPATGSIAEWAREILDRVDSYAEVSPSGKGIKLLVRGGFDFAGRHRVTCSLSNEGHHGIEVYCSSSYFCLTGDRLESYPAEIVTAQAGLDWLAEKYFGKNRSGTEGPVTKQPKRSFPLAGPVTERHPFLLKTASALRWNGADKETILVRLREVNEQRCKPPKEDWELVRIAEYAEERWASEAISTEELSANVRAAESRVKKAQSADHAILEIIQDPFLVRQLRTLQVRDVRGYGAFELAVGLTKAKKETLKVLKASVAAAEPLRAPADSAVVGPAEGSRFVEVFPDAAGHVPDGLRLPPRFVVLNGGLGVEKLAEDGTVETVVPIAQQPIALAAELKDIEDGETKLEIVWRDRGAWSSRIIPRSAFATPTALAEALTGFGAPVTSANAARMVEYLSWMQTLNAESLPLRRVSRRFGWLEGGGFLLGSATIGADGSDVAFEAINAGERQWTEGFAERGTMEGWREVLRLAAPYPRAMATVYASLAAPLLRILDVPNFALDLSGETSSGKTTSLRLAGSVWGSAGDGGKSLLRPWNTTVVGAERLFAVMNDLPVIFDDTKQAKHAEQVTNLVYIHSGGIGRSRGDLEGSRASSTWRSILLSSGEQPLASFSRDAAGANARVLSLWGAPFGNVTKETAVKVRAINSGLAEHHGHAGPALVRYLLAAERETLRQRFRALLEGYHARTTGGASSRQAEKIAVLHLAGEIASSELGLPGDVEAIMAETWAAIESERGEGDRVRAAMDHVLSWSAANARSFLHEGAEDLTNYDDHGRAGQRTASKLRFFPSVLERVLSEAGYAGTVLRSWAEREWISTETQDNETRFKIRVRIGNTRVRMVEIKLEAIGEVGPETGEPAGPAGTGGTGAGPVVGPS